MIADIKSNRKRKGVDTPDVRLRCAKLTMTAQNDLDQVILAAIAKQFYSQKDRIRMMRYVADVTEDEAWKEIVIETLRKIDASEDWTAPEDSPGGANGAASLSGTPPSADNSASPTRPKPSDDLRPGVVEEDPQGGTGSL